MIKIKGGKRMGCNCRVTELIIGIIILIVAVWPGLVNGVIENADGWIIVIAAVILILHSFMCKNVCMPASSRIVAKKKRR